MFGAFDPDEIGTSPLALRIVRHVGDDAVGVELGSRLQLVRWPKVSATKPSHLMPGRLRVAGSQPWVSSNSHSTKSRVAVTASSWARDDPGRGLRSCMEQGLQANRLRCREGDAEAGMVFALAVPQATEAGGGAGDEPGEDFLEAFGFDGAVEAEGRYSSTVPATRLAMLRVVLRVAAVGLEAVDLRSVCQSGNRGDYRQLPYGKPASTKHTCSPTPASF